jgi:hypothetical protein
VCAQIPVLPNVGISHQLLSSTAGLSYTDE